MGRAGAPSRMGVPLGEAMELLLQVGLAQCFHSWCSCSGLRLVRPSTQNDEMQRRSARTLLAVVLLCLCLNALAQNQDRDSSGAAKTSVSAPPVEQRVDINHASIGELLKVPGLTQGWAERVVRF